MLVKNPGRNHYNAKKTRGEQQDQNGYRRINLPSRVIQNNLPHSDVSFAGAGHSNDQDSETTTSDKKVVKSTEKDSKK